MLGQDTDAVLRELGYDEPAIADLHARGIAVG
jgi:crotonobetainyl-CoA:carnitine CoA-transferase CaiB-like acyl-CoA transferase